MVRLQLMTQEDYQHYISFTVDHYAKEHVKTGTWNEEDAKAKSKKTFDDLLPKGIESENQYLFSIIHPELGKIGYLWYQLMERSNQKIAFICDFVVLEDYRGKGYGKEALEALDAEVKERGVSKITLHAFAHNTGAIELYKKMGFEITNIYMAKQV